MSRLVEIDFDPDARTLRQFGVVAFLGFGTLAALAYYEKLVFAWGLGEARVWVAWGLGVLGLVALLFSVVVPRANRLLFVALSLLAFPIGFVLSHLIMATLYFLVIGPVAITLRLLGRDPMKRTIDPAANTYWAPARPRRDKESYFHQY